MTSRLTDEELTQLAEQIIYGIDLIVVRRVKSVGFGLRPICHAYPAAPCRH